MNTHFMVAYIDSLDDLETKFQGILSYSKQEAEDSFKRVFTDATILKIYQEAL